MTRVDIETMLANLAATTRYLRENSRLMREMAEHVVTVSEHSQEVIAHIDAAITAGLTHLHREDEGTS